VGGDNNQDISNITQTTDFTLKYLSKWKKVPFKIGNWFQDRIFAYKKIFQHLSVYKLKELSKDNLGLTEEVANILTNKSNYYTYSSKNVVDFKVIKSSKNGKFNKLLYL
jgi:hypothetical protein